MSKLREEYEKENKLFSDWWDKITVKSDDWTTLERLAAHDSWMEAKGVFLEQKLESQSSQNDLERLYEWLMNENREPGQTKFSSGMLRNVAKEIEFQIHKAVGKERERVFKELQDKFVDAIILDEPFSPNEEDLKQILKLNNNVKL